MNISLENRVIWLAPERTARISKKNFQFGLLKIFGR